MKHLLIIAASAAMLLPVTAAHACPAFEVTVSQAGSISYNPVNASDMPVLVQVSAIGGPLDDACVGVPISISGDTASSQPLTFTDAVGTRLVGNFAPGADASLVLSDLILSDEARSRLVQGLPVVVQIGTIPAGQFLRSGEYSASLRVSVGSNSSTHVLNASIEPAFLLQLSSADGVEDIFLQGDPQVQPLSGSTVLFYRTNADLRVSASSLNGGGLVHELGAAAGRIPYSISLDGTVLNLGSGQTSIDFNFSNPGLQAKTISVQVPPAGPLLAGRYKDVITFSFSPF